MNPSDLVGEVKIVYPEISGYPNVNFPTHGNLLADGVVAVPTPPGKQQDIYVNGKYVQGGLTIPEIRLQLIRGKTVHAMEGGMLNPITRAMLRL